METSEDDLDGSMRRIHGKKQIQRGKPIWAVRYFESTVKAARSKTQRAMG
jgi:hypothetical protein